VTDAGERNVRLAGIEVGPEYLRTLGVPMVLGRSLTDADIPVRPRPTVVSASLARALWPDRSPLSQTFTVPSRGSGAYTVVGVAADFRFGSATGEVSGLTLTAAAMWGGIAELAIHADRPETLVEPIRQRVASLVPDARIEVVSGRELMAHDLGRQRLGAWFFSGFGLVALVLAVGGVFGLVAYLAEARQREFGVRLALGATSSDLIGQAMSTTLIPIGLGSACGLVAAAIIARLVSALLVGISPLDPLSYIAVGTLMIGSAVLAGFLAAWRLRRLMPSSAFRSE
jgi:putative ABC transport system permease protein